MSTQLRISLISLAILLAAGPALAGHRNKAAASDRAIILQNNGMHSANYNGGIILQNQNRSKAIKNRGGIILQNNASNGEQLPPVFHSQQGVKGASAQSNGAIILQRKNRGGIILQNQAKSASGGH